MNTGKTIRISKIINPRTKKTVIIPMDHGISCGPVKGVDNIRETVKQVVAGGADAIILHKGIARVCADLFTRKTSLIIHLSASNDLSANVNHKVLVGSVEEALSLGAQAVSVHVNIGNEYDHLMCEDMGVISRQCERLGMPLLAMMYPRGVNVKNDKDPDTVAHVARLGAEIGADIVKTNYTGSAKSFEKVTCGCPVPVVIAGGSKESDLKALKMIEDSISGGGAGVSIGRNVFQARDVRKMTEAVVKVVHGGRKANEVL